MRNPQQAAIAGLQQLLEIVGSVRGLARELNCPESSLRRYLRGATMPEDLRTRVLAATPATWITTPPSPRESARTLISEQPGLTAKQVMGRSHCSSADIDALIELGFRRELAPASEPDRLGRQRHGWRMYPPQHYAADPSGDGVGDAELLRLLVEKHSRKAVAHALGVSAMAVTYYMAGRTPLSPQRRQKAEMALAADVVTHDAPSRTDLASKMSERLSRIVERHPGLTAGQVRARACSLTGRYDSAAGAAAYKEARDRQLIHEVKEPYTDRSGRGLVRTVVQPGPAPEEPPPLDQVSGAELRQGLERVGLDMWAFGRLADVTGAAVWGWCRDGVPAARASAVRELLERLPATPPPTSVEERAREIRREIARGGRSHAWLERHFGRTQLTRDALSMLFETGDVDLARSWRTGRHGKGLVVLAGLQAPETKEGSLRELREAKGLTRTAVASHVKVSPQWFGKLEDKLEAGLPVDPAMAGRIRAAIESSSVAKARHVRRMPLKEVEDRILDELSGEELTESELRKRTGWHQDFPTALSNLEANRRLIHRVSRLETDKRGSTWTRSYWALGRAPAKQPRPVTGDEFHAACEAARRQSKAVREIASDLGVSEVTVRKWEKLGEDPLPAARWPVARRFIEEALSAARE